MEISQINKIQKFFKDENYVVIKNLISKQMSFLFYEYTKTKVEAINYKKIFDNTCFNELWDGNFGDTQVNRAFYQYGDQLFDTLMKLMHLDIEKYTDLKLNYNYSYFRFYMEGDDMKEHIDRDSCEVSLTMCLGYDISNVDTNKYFNYNWPLWLGHENSDNKLPITLEPGDALLYRGGIIPHFRDKFLGLNQAQVFMHYNEVDGKFNMKLDNRPLLGVPSVHSSIFKTIKKDKK